MPVGRPSNPFRAGHHLIIGANQSIVRLRSFSSKVSRSEPDFHRDLFELDGEPEKEKERLAVSDLMSLVPQQWRLFFDELSTLSLWYTRFASFLS